MTPTPDIVERLRRLYVDAGTNYVQEAADTIERLRAEVASAYAAGRADALEEAARVCEGLKVGRDSYFEIDERIGEAAAAVRALKAPADPPLSFAKVADGVADLKPTP